MEQSLNGRDGDGRRMEFIAAPFTAFDGDGQVNLLAVERQAGVLVERGLRGAFVCGTTGEGASLNSPERVQVAKRWCEVAGDGLEIIVHVGHTSLSEARTLAEHAERSGADGVAAVAPYYFKPRSVLELARFCEEVANAAPRKPFYYYHIPSLTAVDFSMADFLTVASKRIPNLAGIKFTHDNLVDYSRCLDVAEGRYEIFFGRDELLLAAMSVGARAAVGTTYNFATPLYEKIVETFELGDMAAARKAQSLARTIIDMALEYGGLPAFKAMANWVGVNCGPCRLPLTSLNLDEEKELRHKLKQAGFFGEAVGGPGRASRKGD